MNMTYDQYIQNPMGIANSVISNREMYRILYTQKLDKILVRETGNINRLETHLYKDEKGKRYLAYIKIPSEVVPNFYYDVVIEFTEPKKSDKTKAVGYDLNKYNVRFFSNDPSFVFTFAHAFIKNDLFIKELSPKMSNKAIKQNAVEKNPHNIVGYVKSLYFAYIIMNRKGLFNKLKYTKSYNQKALLTNIMHADKKIQLRQELATKLAKDRKREVEIEKRRRLDHLEKEIDDGRGIKKLGVIGSSKTTPKIKPVKKMSVTMKSKLSKVHKTIK